MRLARLVGSVVVALMLVSVVARAQVVPDAEQIEVARRHLAQGIALYNDGNFSAALAEFQAVYATKPTPGVLYNIGLTYKALFQYNEAIHALEQYEGEEKQLTPERRAEVTQILAEMQALLAPMTLAITPEGAEVKIDGRVVGKAPIGAYKMAAGRHVIEASHDGYTTRSRDVMVTAGVPGSVQLELPIIPKSGRVRIVVTPASATVRIDGNVVPPPLDAELALGGHTLEVEERGYQLHREEIIIAPSQLREVEVHLARPPIYKRAALWVPVAAGIVVAVGLGVGLGVGLNQDQPITGTLSPGKMQVGR